MQHHQPVAETSDITQQIHHRVPQQETPESRLMTVGTVPLGSRGLGKSVTCGTLSGSCTRRSTAANCPAPATDGNIVLQRNRAVAAAKFASTRM